MFIHSLFKNIIFPIFTIFNNLKCSNNEDTTFDSTIKERQNQTLLKLQFQSHTCPLEYHIGYGEMNTETRYKIISEISDLFKVLKNTYDRLRKYVNDILQEYPISDQKIFQTMLVDTCTIPEYYRKEEIQNLATRMAKHINGMEIDVSKIKKNNTGGIIIPYSFKFEGKQFSKHIVLVHHRRAKYIDSGEKILARAKKIIVEQCIKLKEEKVESNLNLKEK